MSSTIELTWAEGHLAVSRLGAILRDCVMRLPDGRDVAPLHRAPWLDTEEGDRQSGLMRGLAGEWPCLPFGAPSAATPDAWRGQGSEPDPFPHGYAAHHDWVVRRRGGGIEAQIALPDDHPIEEMRRAIVPKGNTLKFTLSVRPRRDCVLPLGLHPNVSLPLAPDALAVDIEGSCDVWHHPDAPSSDPTPLAPGAVFPDLASIRTAQGTALDLSRLPPEMPCEIRLLISATGGSVRLDNAEAGTRTLIAYDPNVFPAVMLWISNGGRMAAPWNGRNRCLGVEPVAAPFDLGTAAAVSPNPLSSIGIPTGITFRAGQSFRTAYSISVAPLSNF